MGYSTSQNVGGATNTTTLTDSQNRISTVSKVFDNSGNVGIYITPTGGTPQTESQVDDSFAGLSGNKLLWIGVGCLAAGAFLLKGR